MYYSPFNQFQNYSIRQESITRVTGEEGAKAYQMAPNSSAALFDGNEDIFYLKTTDGAGFPTIRKFKFEEIQAKTPEPAEESDYITREEFEQFRDEIRNYGEQYIQKSAETEQRRTESGLCSAMNFNGLENSVGRLNDSLQADYMGLQNGLSNIGYENLRNFNETQNRISDCCCTTQRAIDGVNYNGAINTAAINANTTEQMQKVLDAIAQNKIEALQAQVNQLQLQAAMCGVVRYPNATTYCSGSNPFGGCGCGAAI